MVKRVHSPEERCIGSIGYSDSTVDQFVVGDMVTIGNNGMVEVEEFVEDMKEEVDYFGKSIIEKAQEEAEKESIEFLDENTFLVIP